jgi:hypothetical protein
MTSADAFRALVRHSLDLALYAWPISLVLIAVALFALFYGKPLAQLQFRRGLWAILPTYAFPVAVIIVGTVLRYDWVAHPTWTEPPDWHGVVLWAVLVLHAIALIAVILVLKGVRMRSAAILLPGFWLSLSCGFVAGVAMAGVGP